MSSNQNISLCWYCIYKALPTSYQFFNTFLYHPWQLQYKESRAVYSYFVAFGKSFSILLQLDRMTDCILAQPSACVIFSPAWLRVPQPIEYRPEVSTYALCENHSYLVIISVAIWTTSESLTTGIGSIVQQNVCAIVTNRQNVSILFLIIMKYYQH